MYLVIGYNVNGAVCGVGWQVTQMERLVHYTLAREGSVTMQQDAHHLYREK